MRSVFMPLPQPTHSRPLPKALLQSELRLKYFVSTDEHVSSINLQHSRNSHVTVGEVMQVEFALNFKQVQWSHDLHTESKCRSQVTHFSSVITWIGTLTLHSLFVLALLTIQYFTNPQFKIWSRTSLSFSSTFFCLSNKLTKLQDVTVADLDDQILHFKIEIR